MEKLLLENAPVTDAELRALADQRALAVKQSLEREGKVADSKLFLTAPKLTAEGIKDKGAPNRVDFSIRQ
jgi:outer membrane protein OmpA-like peptidoglycan-associated protein